MCREPVGSNANDVIWSARGIAVNMDPLMMRTFAPAFIMAPPVFFSTSTASSANQISGDGKFVFIRASAAESPNAWATIMASTSPWGGLESSRYGTGIGREYRRTTRGERQGRQEGTGAQGHRGTGAGR